MRDKPTQTADHEPRRLKWWPLALVGVIFVFALFGDRGILHLFRLKRQGAELQQQLAQIEAVNNGLRQEIASLSADRRHLERLARTQLGMVREDELVFQFASKDRPAAPVAPAAAPLAHNSR